jgi:UPF0271 protein
MKIDLNADVGESYEEKIIGNDSELIPLVSSVNIACGFHGGDPLTMKRTIEIAIRSGAKIGAHPSFADLENFGRKAMDVPPEKLEAQILYQLSALSGMLASQGQTLHHVKLHGALYHHVSENAEAGNAVLNAIQSHCPSAFVVAAAGSKFLARAAARRMRVQSEGFVDRRYQNDGTLTPRSQKGSSLETEEECLKQALEIARSKTVTAQDGTKIPMKADTLCIHGDHVHSVAVAKKIRKGLEDAGFKITSFI